MINLDIYWQKLICLVDYFSLSYKLLLYINTIENTFGIYMQRINLFYNIHNIVFQCILFNI